MKGEKRIIYIYEVIQFAKPKCMCWLMHIKLQIWFEVSYSTPTTIPVYARERTYQHSQSTRIWLQANLDVFVI